ncbi:SpoIIE family protein phosphatase [Streptomyces spinosirectus]|jgi:serine phosphatase RsbU (regulator of sigma subunit)/anti-sigma regulatory factor (Ser/Thr protein kinase)|uniref:SpoIIE family protein phosphatase n=1 Tax=Streptomyces TaxID=1883 RepID=UPI000D3C8DC6|nr:MULTISPECIES: SpoIIE family protein phosphatase [Streptomyces]MBY8340982.1 SpoIIE family protein phosphatase [Streptomyces plumbidurans]UIR22405.1 SpoIIE family protein phosphatase [Streptomyces spinosirectus]
MDPTPSSSAGSPFDVVSGALTGYRPRGGTTRATGQAAAQNNPPSGPTAEDPSEAGGGDRPETGGQEQILAVVSLDRDLKITSCNLDAAPFAGVSAAPGTDFAALLPPGDVATVTQRLRNAVETREAHVARVQRLRRDDGTELVVSMSILPSAERHGGLTVSLIAMAKRLHLYASATAIGTSLDIGETAQSLAQSLLAWGDVAAVDLDFAVWTGEAVTEQTHERIRLRRAALVPDRPWPKGYLTCGDNLPREASRLLVGAVTRDDLPQAVVIPDREAIERVLGDPRLVRALVPGNLPATVACIPLVVEGPEGAAGPIVLGVTEVWRRPERPFRDSELFDLQELVAKTARHVDLARQHQREHAQVLALQRRLLPRAGSDTIEVASVYLPTTPDSAGVGGDWVNSFPLPGDRTALVVGDVVGHGLGAAATMGQLSMEARALLSAGLGPGEVLERLDETVTLLDDTDAGLAAGYSALGSTCCIAVYDPVDHRVTLSNAGHLPPVLVHPDGSAATITAQPHPGLGTGFAVREPFDVQEFSAPPGSLLALYTDGLVEEQASSIDNGIDRLTDLVRDVHPWDDLQATARRVVGELAPQGRLRDDVTLLLARMTGRRSRDTATWQLPAHDDTAARARSLASSLLRRWRTSDQAQERVLLVISELVTNAVLFGTGPVTVRLVKAGDHLTCEVGDTGNGRPRLRHSDVLDDSGRGLYVMHKLTTRWGVRWTNTGKAVWAELDL